jgi:DNA modification methylase
VALPRRATSRNDPAPSTRTSRRSPDELARRCILASTLPGDVVLDPFSGSGTTERVARQLGRHGIGVDLYAGRPDLVNGYQPRTEETTP